MNKQEFIEKNNLRCKCGEPAVDCDSRFIEYTPCLYHRGMSTVEYSHKGSIAMCMESRKIKYGNSGGILD